MVVMSSGEAGAQGHEQQGDDSLGDAQPQGDDLAVLHQQVGADGDDTGTGDQERQVLPEGTFPLLFLLIGGVGVAQAVPDRQEHIHGEDSEHRKAQPAGEGAQAVGGQAVDGGGEEEEKGGGLHGLGIHGAGVPDNGDGGDQGGVADDGADGVAIGHCAGAHQSAGGGDHDLGQGGADGDHGGAHHDIGQVEPPGHAGGAVHEPVAAVDQQHQADGEQ